MGHIFRARPLLVAVVEEVQHVQHGLRVFLLLLLANVRVLQHQRPLLWHTLCVLLDECECGREQKKKHIN